MPSLLLIALGLALLTAASGTLAGVLDRVELRLARSSLLVAAAGRLRRARSQTGAAESDQPPGQT